MPNLPPELFVIVLLPWLVIHVAFALAVGSDAGNLPEGRRPIFVGKWVWFLTVMMGGPLFAIAYWIMHHSMISPFVYNASMRENKGQF